MERRSSHQVNRHHTFWEKREFRKNGILNRLREHQGFVIPMDLFDHRELHRDVSPPPKPTLQQAEELLGHIGRYDDQSERIDYIDMAVAFLSDKNPRLAQHLTVQRGYVLLNPFTQVERDIVEMERVLAEQERLGGVNL